LRFDGVFKIREQEEFGRGLSKSDISSSKENIEATLANLKVEVVALPCNFQAKVVCIL